MEQGQMSVDEIEQTLLGFMGSEYFYRLYPNVIITEGVKFLSDQCKSYWLIDCIYSYQFTPDVAKTPFQVIDLIVDRECQKGTIIVTDGNDVELFRQEIEYTDFPLAKIRLYYTDSTVLLPREY